MKRKRAYDEDEPSVHARIIPDFLPSPEEFAKAFRKQKVTILLDQQVIGFFKAHARKSGGKYQQLMREVLRHYVAHHQPRRAA